MMAVLALSPTASTFPSKIWAIIASLIWVSFRAQHRLTIEGEGVFAFGGAVPEPSTWAMMLLGFLGLAIRAIAEPRSLAPCKAASRLSRQFLPENRNPEYNASHVNEASGGDPKSLGGGRARPLANIGPGERKGRKNLFDLP